MKNFHFIVPSLWICPSDKFTLLSRDNSSIIPCHRPFKNNRVLIKRLFSSLIVNIESSFSQCQLLVGHARWVPIRKMPLFSWFSPILFIQVSYCLAFSIVFDFAESFDNKKEKHPPSDTYLKLQFKRIKLYLN